MKERTNNLNINIIEIEDLNQTTMVKLADVRVLYLESISDPSSLNDVGVRKCIVCQ